MNQKMIYPLWLKLKHAAEWQADPDSDPVPRFVERDLRRYPAPDTTE